MEKDYDAWTALKAWLHDEHRAPRFQERDVWWCSVGLNVGYEIDGKNQFFNRPVLVVRKFNRHVFWGVPLTTKTEPKPYRLPIRFKGHSRCVILSQVRLWDAKRLTHKMGQLPDEQCEKVREALRSLL